jgi:DNA-binding LytR/AlgR family response regulator
MTDDARAEPGGTGVGTDGALASIAVEVAGRPHAVRRDEVLFVEACGDYVRLHTADRSPLARVSLVALESAWTDAGFVRVHRRYLVALSAVTEVRLDTSSGAGSVVIVAGREIPVSRRQARDVKDRLSTVPRREPSGPAFGGT